MSFITVVKRQKSLGTITPSAKILTLISHCWNNNRIRLKMSDESSIQVLKERTDRCVQELNKNLDELEALFRTAKKEQGKQRNDELGKPIYVVSIVDNIAFQIAALRSWKETYRFFCAIPLDLYTDTGMLQLLNNLVYTLDGLHGTLIFVVVL